MKLLDAWKKESGVQEMTPEIIRALILEVNNDPLAGLGSLSKLDIIVDKLMAQWRICSAQIKGIPVRDAKPFVLTEQARKSAEGQANAMTTAEKAAAASKAAGM